MVNQGISPIMVVVGLQLKVSQSFIVVVDIQT
jgi:hypothetical protein